VAGGAISTLPKQEIALKAVADAALFLDLLKSNVHMGSINDDT